MSIQSIQKKETLIKKTCYFLKLIILLLIDILTEIFYASLIADMN